MAQPFKNRSEGRKKWEKGLDNSGNIEGNSKALLRCRPGCTPPLAAASGMRQWRRCGLGQTSVISCAFNKRRAVLPHAPRARRGVWRSGRPQPISQPTRRGGDCRRGGHGDAGPRLCQFRPGVGGDGHVTTSQLAPAQQQEAQAAVLAAMWPHGGAPVTFAMLPNSLWGSDSAKASRQNKLPVYILGSIV